MNKVELQHIAHLLVRAYKLCIADYLHTGKIKADTRFFAVPSQSQAPQSLQELRECYDEGVLPIAEEFSEHAIYGRSGNVVFRAWHDCGHLILDKEMDAKDEKDLAALQWLDIYRFIQPEHQKAASLIYLADTWAQTHYCELTGRFPARQDLFVQDVVTAMEQGVNISLAVEGYIAQERRRLKAATFSARYSGKPTVLHPASDPAPEGFWDAVSAALAAESALLDQANIREFAGAVLAHNESLRQYRQTYSRLMLAASRFPRKAQYPYGKEKLLCN